MYKAIRKAAATAALTMGAAFLAAPANAAGSPGSGIYAGDWLVRLRAIEIAPDARGNGTLGAIGADVNNAIVPELDFTYMATNNIGVELILGTSRNQVTSNIGALGGVGVLPPTLLLQYHFNNAGRVRPYVGAGINYTLFYNNGLHAGGQSVSIDNHSWGPALQFGIDFQVTKRIFVNADIKKIWMRTDASLGGTPIGTLHIDPLVVGLGVGMKF
ncbi:outer membrane protein [Paraburkholderia silvatlantica]|uniref:Outer membrane protein n=2 Tax=Paraburkholderia silvatlantica TaxID=321895 RepID=A0ABR6FPP0_9BURK|nr:OmpW family outer membrane protein [Paraburkholderia silvatlantica]MBB2929371.1 outer membrane protein [Paraburkholderia silvatlantica]PVY35937.1 outer membrane protein [Paraburkholderia silvatlantica]PXW39885.1 outer membrane protein [Paraburkholderia silvatlantica]TDQ99509.1 outer membrane protein [Paraburkholderia silvatlantica]